MEIKEEMSKLLKNIKLPPEIHIIINEIYKEYQNAYKKLIKYIRNKYPNKEKEILKIEQDTLKDYEEDIEMIETIEFEEYEQRRTILIQTINNILKCVKEKRNIPIGIFENNITETTKEKQNQQFAKIIVRTAVSEMETSGKYFINKINHLGLKNDEELETIKMEFIEKIIEIKEKIIEKLPEINEIINEHFKRLYEQLENIIEKYKIEVQQKEKENYIEEKDEER